MRCVMRKLRCVHRQEATSTKSGQRVVYITLDVEAMEASVDHRREHADELAGHTQARPASRKGERVIEREREELMRRAVNVRRREGMTYERESHKSVSCVIK